MCLYIHNCFCKGFGSFLLKKIQLKLIWECSHFKGLLKFSHKLIWPWWVLFWKGWSGERKQGFQFDTFTYFLKRIFLLFWGKLICLHFSISFSFGNLPRKFSVSSKLSSLLGWNWAKSTFIIKKFSLWGHILFIVTYFVLRHLHFSY